MRNFSIMPLEERIVLDATLVSQLLTFNIDAGESIDLRGPESILNLKGYAIGNLDIRNGLAGDYIDVLTGQVLGDGGNYPLPFNQPNDFFIDSSSQMQSVQFTQFGQHLIQFDFRNSDIGPNVTVAIVNVRDPNLASPTFQNVDQNLSIQEGLSAPGGIIGAFNFSDTSITDPSLFSLSFERHDGLNLSQDGAASVVYSGTPGLFYVEGNWDFLSGSGDLSFVVTYEGDATHNAAIANLYTSIVTFESVFIDLTPSAEHLFEGTEGSVILPSSNFYLGTFDLINGLNRTSGDFILTATSINSSAIVDFHFSSSLDVTRLSNGNYGISMVSISLLDYDPDGQLLITVVDKPSGSVLNIVHNYVIDDAPLSLISDGTVINAPEGSVIEHLLLGSFRDSNSLQNVSGNVDDFLSKLNITTSDPSIVVSNLSVVFNSTNLDFSIYGDLTLKDVVDGSIVVRVNDQGGGPSFVNLTTSVHALDSQISLGGLITIKADQGILFDGKVGSFVIGNLLEDASNFDGSIIDWGDGTTSLATIVSLGNGAFEVWGSHTYASNPFDSAGSFTVQDGNEGSATGLFKVLGSPIIVVSDPVPNITAIEGQFFDKINALSFIIADPNLHFSDLRRYFYTDFGDLAGASLRAEVSQDSAGVVHFLLDFNAGTDIGSATLIVAPRDGYGNPFVDINGNEIRSQVNIQVTEAPKTVGPMVTADLILGPSYIKVGSFTDANPNEPVGNYVVSVDNDTAVAGNGGAVGILVNTGAGAYDVYAQLNYDSTGSKHGTFTISEKSYYGTQQAGSLIEGNFDVNVRPNQLLWGVDENTGRLFSVADYAVAGAEGRVTDYGQLHTASGVIIGGNISAFTIDGADANGHNAAYIAISKSVGGINTFSIGVIADINDLNNNTVVTLYSISGLKLNLSKDSITGLAVDPITGNLMGVVTSNGSSSALFVIDKNTLSSSNHVAEAYTLGNMIGKDSFTGMKVANARDLAFDNAGNLFVTDGASDRLYRINASNGEIIGVANANEGNGLSSNPNIEALAWDPNTGKLVGANSVAGASDLVGLALDGGPNMLDTGQLLNLQDIQGIAFKPQFEFHAGQDLGALIDANSTATYIEGSGNTLLLHNVDLVTFGETTYDGISLTIDVSDNADGLTDFLSIQKGGGISVVNGNVMYKNLWIGTVDAMDNGKNGNALVIHLNANAGEKGVETLMQRIAYMNTATNIILGNRVISFTLTDSLGAIIGYTTVDLDVQSSSLATL